MKRREFIGLVGAAAFPARLTAQTRPSTALRVGLVSAILPRTAPMFAAFDRRLRELGYVEGQNFTFDFVNMNGETARFPEAAQELTRRGIDILVASGPELALRAAVAATSTLPIVMIAIDYDPFARGYVTSLSRPGRNVTGLFFRRLELAVKRIELVKEAFPDIQSATVFWDEISAPQWAAVQDPSISLSLRLQGAEFREKPFDYDRVLAAVPAESRRIVIVMMSPLFFPDRSRIAEVALRYRMGSMFGLREYVEAGGLFSYGPSITRLFARAAEIVDRIARGAKPSDLPIEQPAVFEFVANLKTARMLDLTIPPALLARADQVIE
jgi:putative ABC transport system substrate-binding protein